MNQRKSNMNIKRNNELKTTGKAESDIMKGFLEKKLKGEMMKKAEQIVQRNTALKEKQKIQVKRLFSQKMIRSKSHCEPRQKKPK